MAYLAMSRFLAALYVLALPVSVASQGAAEFWNSTFNYSPISAEGMDINPCILPGSDYKFLEVVSLPSPGPHSPFGGACVVLGENSYMIFAQSKPSAITEYVGYIGMMFKYVTTLKTFKANYGTTYKSYEGQGVPLVKFDSISQEKFNELKEKGVPMGDMGKQAESFAISVKEKVCVKLASMANICAGIVPAEGRRLGTHERLLGSHEAEGGSMWVSMDVSEIEGSAKSMKIGDIDKDGKLSSVKASIVDGDGGMKDFMEAKKWDVSILKATTTTTAPPTTTTTKAQAAVADLAVVTNGLVGLAFALLAHAVFF